jgi:hypothetical protein
MVLPGINCHDFIAMKVLRFPPWHYVRDQIKKLNPNAKDIMLHGFNEFKDLKDYDDFIRLP